jgi:hypothetical protein
MPQAASAHDTFWDFISLMPESIHVIMWVMSGRAIPRELPHDGRVRGAHFSVRHQQRSIAKDLYVSSWASKPYGHVSQRFAGVPQVLRPLILRPLGF